MAFTAVPDPSLDIAERIAQLEARVAATEQRAERAEARAAVENVFSNYMYCHNAFQDHRIIDLWVSKGTPGIRAQYSNKGVLHDVGIRHRVSPRTSGTDRQAHHALHDDAVDRSSG